MKHTLQQTQPFLMKFTTSGKNFTLHGQTVWYTFNLLQIEDCATAYFIAFEDDNYAKAISPVTVYFEYFKEARAWILVSDFQIPDDLLQQMRDVLAVIDPSQARVIDMG
jgi:hypothetical protein